MTEAEIIKKVWKLFKKIVRDCQYDLYLFGSRSTRNHTKYSDFDFCVVGEKPVSSKKINKLKEAIENMDTLYSIDVVDFQKASLEFREIVEKEMVKIIDGKIRSA